MPGTWGPAVIKDLRAGDPASVGPYRLLGRLGTGGMGQVYLARSPGGRLVAIKLIRPELAEEGGFRARFASEITAARNVSGIYTAAVVDADADAELPWMATVYVPGPSLADAVEDTGPLPVKTVFALAAGLAEALEAIHRAGLVHRDLKPSNVLLASDGPRVIDFGISLALERSMMTATGMVMGSPGFMSPEQARGQREVGAPSDMFSLGAVLAFAATGSSPFGIGPTPALLYRVVNEAPDLAAVPARLAALIGQCLAKNPADRPAPAEVLELLGDDVDVLTGEWLPPAVTQMINRYSGPATSAPQSAASVPPRPAGPEPTVLADIPAAATADHGMLPDTSLVPVPGAVTAGRDSGGAGGTPPAEPPSPFRRWRWPIVAAAVALVIVAAVVAILLTSHSSGGGPRVGVTPTGSLAGNATKAATPHATTARPASTPARQPTSQPAASTPVTQAPTTASPTSASPTPTPTPTKTTPSPTTTPTPTQSTSSTSASAPTTTSSPTQATPTSGAPTSSSASTSNSAPASNSATTSSSAQTSDTVTTSSSAPTSDPAPTSGSAPTSSS
ncbi:MAG TPA: protein kinase, partial [Trebonia sp.]|nr:protein kinase [Trebonia sp.]